MENNQRGIELLTFEGFLLDHSVQVWKYSVISVCSSGEIMLLQSLWPSPLWLPCQQPPHLTGALKPQRYWIPPKPVPHPCWGVRVGSTACSSEPVSTQHRPKQDVRRKRNERCYSGKGNMKKIGAHQRRECERMQGGPKVMWWHCGE